MATLIENTNKVVTSFDEIRQAIIGKGVDVPSGTSVEEYASLIASIVVGFDPGSVTAEAGDVLDGKIIIGADGTEIKGTMPNNGGVSSTLLAGESFEIPEGYHDGSGIAKAEGLASQTEATALASQIMNGKTAWINGTKVTGTMKNHGSYECEIEAASIKVDGMTGLAGNTELPGGYYSKVTITPPTVDIADYTPGTATADEILSGETAYVNGSKVTGTMTNQGAKTASLNAGGSYTIPKGYHNGTGKVTANSLASQTDGTAAETDILSGATAYVDGVKITGTMTNQGSKTASLNAGESYTIPKGYHNGSGKITANSLAGQTDGTATAAQILTGQTAYVDGVKVTGTMTNQGAKTASLNAGGSYTIPAGYHNGSGKITANSLASQTDGTATASDILSEKTAYVDGAKVTGTIASKAAATYTPGTANQTIAAGQYLSGTQTIKGDANLVAGNILSGKSIFGVSGTATADATATAAQILSGKTGYVKGTKVTGTMANQGAKTASLNAGGSYTIPAGYHNGSGKVTANSLASQTQATATASQILSGQTAYVNGVKVTGTMTNWSEDITERVILAADESYTIPEGYHDGTEFVLAQSLGSQTVATATAEDILAGKTAWVGGELITGTREGEEETVDYIIGEFDTGSVEGTSYVDISFAGTASNPLFDWVPSAVVFTEDMRSKKKTTLFKYALLEVSQSSMSVRVRNDSSATGTTRKVQYIAFK